LRNTESYAYGTTLVVLLVLVLSIPLGSCARLPSDDGTRGPHLSITDDTGALVELDGPPERIVCMDTANLSYLYLLGAEAVGRPSTKRELPARAERLPEVGRPNMPDLEAIVALKPDLVLGSENPKQIEAAGLLRREGIQTAILASHTYEDTERVLRLLGHILGREREAEEEWASVARRVEALLARVPSEGPRVLALWGGTETIRAALPPSFIGSLIELLHGRNVAPAVGDGTRYAQLDMESVVESDPQVVLIVAHGLPQKVKASLERKLGDHPAWSALEAVKNGEIHYLPFDLFSTHPGARLPEAVEVLAGILYPEAVRE